MKFKKLIKIKLSFLSLLLSFYSAINALDTTFGSNNGIVTTAIDETNAQINNINLQSNNSIIGIGSFGNNDSQFALAKYTTGGLLDTTFGINGIALTTIDQTAQAFAGGVNNASGTIIAGGFASDNITSKFALTRYNSAGSLDSSFGSSGVVRTLIGQGCQINALALDSSNNIVAAGSSSSSGTGEFTIARYLAASGSLDTSGFNSSGSQPGVVTTQIQNQSSIQAIAIQSSNGKIVVGGYSKGGSTNNQFTIARYNTNGTLDTSGFNSSGSQPGVNITSIGSFDEITGIAIDSSSNIVAAGFATISGTKQFAVARYTSAGVLDSTFATSGVFTTSTSNFPNGAVANSIAIQPNGNILVGGYSNGTVTEFAIIRITNSGNLDSTFGTGGIETLLIQASSQANSILIQPDGKIVAGGLAFSSITDSNLFALARFDSSNTNFINITSLVNGSTIGTRTPNISGNASVNGAEVDVYIDNSLFVTGSTSSTGAWNAGSTNILSNSQHIIQSNLLVSGIKVADFALNTTINASDSITITVPTINSILGLATTQISGTSNVASSKIVVFLDGLLFNVVTTNSSGSWNAGTSLTLGNGNHVIEAIIINSSGNISASAADIFSVSLL